MPLKNWSVTAGSNTSAAPNGAPEGMTMASVNDTIRQIMADVRTLAAPTTLAAATTTDIGSKDETIITLTGVAVTITGLGTVSAGIYKFVIYNAAHILTHNATSLILVGGANRTVAAGDSSLFVSEGSGNWRELTFSDVSETLTSYLPKAGGTLTGLFTQAAGADIASAATIDLTAATGNSPRITGTTATSAVTMNAGQQVRVVANGAWPLTYHATTNKINSAGANVTLAAGDIVDYHKDLSGVVHGKVTKTDGTAIVSSNLTLGTAVASTSGTSINFTGIPAGTKQIDIMFASVSTNGASNLLVQLGDSGGVEITGYLGSNFDGVTIVGGIVDGFRVPIANDAAISHGLITLRLLNAATFSWVAMGTLGRSDGNGIAFFGGSKLLSAELDRVRVTTVTGTDIFDAGVINISYR